MLQKKKKLFNLFFIYYNFLFLFFLKIIILKQTTKINLLAKLYLDSDVIIYDLNTCDLEEAEFAIKSK